MKILYKIISVLLLIISPLILQVKGSIILGKTNRDFAETPDTLPYNKLFKITPFYLDIIPPSSGVQFYKDGIVFLSSTRNNNKMVSRHISFGTPEANWSVPGDSVPGVSNVFSLSGFFPYPCDALTFSSDFTTMYFTKYSKTSGKDKIYQAKISPKSKGQTDWSENTDPLDVCRDRFNYTNPALSLNGKIMVFASDRTGSAGGLDLFVIKKDGDTWSAPENLGRAINTKGNELFPAFDSENNLYFSSDGLPGNGGYDIFMSKYSEDKWEKPVNLTKVINSDSDEIAFSINRNDGTTAFFTKRHTSGNGKMQLYKVTLNDALKSQKTLNLSLALYSLAVPDNGADKSKLSGNGLVTEKIKADSIKSAEIEAKKNRDAKIKADSIEALKTLAAVAETKKTESDKYLSDSIEAVRSKEVMLRAEREDADKNEAARIKAERTNSLKLKADSVEKFRTQNNNVVNDNPVVFKIQIASNARPKGKYEISINGISYLTSEYLYMGAYRTTVGEFSSLKPAMELQKIFRKSGYPQAFVIVFKNNVRTNDPALFK